MVETLTSDGRAAVVETLANDRTVAVGDEAITDRIEKTANGGTTSRNDGNKTPVRGRMKATPPTNHQGVPTTNRFLTTMTTGRGSTTKTTDSSRRGRLRMIRMRPSPVRLSGAASHGGVPDLLIPGDLFRPAGNLGV